jgi:anti-sigma regulatory factor (Ser/Thr protein kinase)
LEGIAAGVFYYLTKPYEKTTLLTILTSALEHRVKNRKSVDEMTTHTETLKMLESGRYKFRTLNDAKYLAFAISNIFQKPDKTLFGLHELCINAVEHGNLGIGFEGKKKLIKTNSWEMEVQNRLDIPENANKFATLEVQVFDDRFEITIKDSGNGFDFEEYMKFEPSRLTSPNGRGIAMSKMYSFDEMEYRGNGNEVFCIVRKHNE